MSIDQGVKSARRNLLAISIAFIVFYFGGGYIPEGEKITLFIINLGFQNESALAVIAWILLIWSAFRFWQVSETPIFVNNIESYFSLLKNYQCGEDWLIKFLEKIGHKTKKDSYILKIQYEYMKIFDDKILFKFNYQNSVGNSAGNDISTSVVISNFDWHLRLTLIFMSPIWLTNNIPYILFLIAFFSGLARVIGYGITPLL